MILKRPITILDLETTGIWLDKDKIIEIAMVKCLPDGSRETYDQRVNPGIPIPSVVTAMTSITDNDVKNSPKFKEIASAVKSFIGDSDIGGFNVERFDLPMLQKEMAEASVTWELGTRAVYDAQKVFHYHEKRDLTSAYKFFCNKELVDAHAALADCQATLDILASQVDKYGNGQKEIELLKQFDYVSNDSFFDKERKFRWWNKELYMMFGKYARKESLKDVAKNDPGYLKWILTADFSDEVKDLVKKALNGTFPEPPANGAA